MMKRDQIEDLEGKQANDVARIVAEFEHEPRNRHERRKERAEARERQRQERKSA